MSMSRLRRMHDTLHDYQLPREQRHTLTLRLEWRWLALVLGLFSTLAISRGASAQRESDTARYRSRAVDTVVSVGATPTIDLSLWAGSIRVTTWNRPQVKVSATAPNSTLRFRASPSRVELNNETVSVDMRRNPDRATDRAAERAAERARDRAAERSDSSSRRHGFNFNFDFNMNVDVRTNLEPVRYEVTVPAGARVFARGFSGSVSVVGTGGEVEARTVSGDIAVSGAGRSVTAEAVSGGVTIENVAGDVRGNSVSGDVTVRGVAGDVTLESVSGSVNVSGARSTRVSMTSVSGNVRYEGSTDPAGRYTFGTHSGRVQLALADNSSASVGVESFSGDVRMDYPGARRSGQDQGEDNTRYRYTIGDGAARISVETFSGNVVITRGSGRSNPRE